MPLSQVFNCYFVGSQFATLECRVLEWPSGSIWRGSAEQFALAVDELNGEIDAAINERAEAFEIGEQRLDPGQFHRPNVARTTAHVVSVAELPVGAVLRDRVPVLLTEGTWAHGPELGESVWVRVSWACHFASCLSSTAGSFPAKRRGSPAGGCGRAKFFDRESFDACSIAFIIPKAAS